MDNRPIGVFDSGLGGLTAVKEIKRVLPHESIVYFGDTGRVPYGTRSRDTLLKYTEQDINFLLKNNVKAVVAACGTVSSTAGEVGERLDIPYINVIKPTALSAIAATKNKKIGVIGTSATVNSHSFEKAIHCADENMEVFAEACPLFVSLVENGYIAPQDEVTRLVAERYLAPIRERGVDTLILGCTHFPIIKAIIGSVMGMNVKLIDSGRETARHCAAVLERESLLCADSHRAEYSYFVSDTTDGFTNIAEVFLGSDIDGPVKKADIEKF